MITLFVLVEGQTEEAFVKAVLTPHLRTRGVEATVIIVETRRAANGRKHRGGGDWSKWERDLHRLTRGHHDNKVRFTTLFDLYGLPKKFPKYGDHGSDKNTTRRAELLEKAMAEAVGDWRFIPYLQRHEFEALVLAGLPQLENLLDDSKDLDGLATLKKDIGALAPEDINDGESTAPSKRLEARIPSYRKTVHGPLVVEAVGLASLRAACPRFDKWLSALEALG